MLCKKPEVLIDKKFCRTVANKYDIPHVTLRRYCLNYRKEAAIVKGDDITEVSLRKYGYFNNRSVFNISQKLLLVEYLLKASAYIMDFPPMKSNLWHMNMLLNLA